MNLPRPVVLPYRPPFAWAQLLAFLRGRAIPGIEAVDETTYRRVVGVEGMTGWIAVCPHPARDALVLDVRIGDARHLPEIATRVERLFDLDADPQVIAAHFGADRVLAPRVRRVPGLRVPGAWDAFELGVRAILGQQVTVKGASTLAGRLVQMHGRPVTSMPAGLTHLFPSPGDIASADLSRLGVPARRQESLRRFARALATGAISLSRPDLALALEALPGIGDWTAQYILMRACGDPDAFPASDLWLRRAAGATTVKTLRAQAEAWRPWRAYAAMYLWQGGAFE